MLGDGRAEHLDICADRRYGHGEKPCPGRAEGIDRAWEGRILEHDHLVGCGIRSCCKSSDSADGGRMGFWSTRLVLGRRRQPAVIVPSITNPVL
jgi:hypothetical protein